MSYGKRIDTLCSLLEKAEVFADIGCDHGYCTEYMLKNALCKHAIFSDVSRGSLEKAKAYFTQLELELEKDFGENSPWCSGSGKRQRKSERNLLIFPYDSDKM